MKKLLRYLFLVLLLFVNVKAKAQFNGYWEDYSKGIYNISGLSNYFQRPLIELLSPDVIKQIKEIKITAGKITPGLCKDIPNLSKVTISDATIIAESAFRNCHSLKIVDIPESVTMISFAAFKDCDSISSLYIPESVTEIADSAFYACRSLKNINIPKGVTILRTYVFAYTGLTNITIPQSVSEIYVSTFEGCTSLTSVNIPNSISSISSRTFFNCYNLTSVNIPNSVRRIEKEAFKHCTSLTSITLPKGLVVLERGAFYNCSSLRSVDIPNSVTHIESETFRGAGLRSVNIPNGVISIGDWAFEDCTSLTSITLPKSVAAIGKGAFYNCNNIESVNILSEGEIEIGPKAFNSCTSLKYVNIPNGEPNIGNEAFWGCTSLKGVSIPNDVKNIGVMAFCRCRSLTNLIIPKVKNSVIGNGAFIDCTSLTSIIIPEGVRNIGNHAFLNCSSLTNVDIPESVTHIGDSTFLGCSSLISVNIPNGVKNIGERTFKNCSSLISVNIPDSAKDIYRGAFENCTSLTSIVIPDSVEGIGNDAFYGCTNLKTVFNLSKLDIVKGSEWHGHVAFYADEVITDGIILSSNNLHLMTHDTYKLSANTREGQYVTWSSSDESVATVDNDGNVTAIGVGTATITATTDEDSATCKVEVNEHDWLFNHTTGHLEVNINYQYYNTVDLPWYTLKNLIKSVKIGKRAEFIATYEFADCSSLTSVTISEGVYSIGHSAFIGCPSLSSITLPKSLRIIRDGAFKDCSSLTSIIIPDRVEYIGEKAFEGCTNLKTVINKSCLDIVKGSETHGHVAYYADTVLTGGIIFNNTPSPLEIRPYETYSISVIVIPDEMRITWSSSNESVATVDQNGKVTAVGEGIATITATAENYSKTLEVRVVKNWWFDPHTGCLEVNNWSTNYDESDKYPWYKYKDSIKSVRIGSIETLGACAFKGYPSLTTVTISGHIREIKENAFKDCPSLRSVNMPNRVDIIYSGMFEGCYSLTNVTMPNSMYEIPVNMFKGCSSLTSIKIPDIAKYINSGAFEGCSSLTNITIPNSVDQIRDNAFKGCTNLKTVINLSFLNIVKGSEWYGHVAYYAEEVKTFGFKNKKSSMPKNGTSVLPGTWPSNGVVTFSSSDESVATVDNNGKITTKDKGTTIITATTEYGSVTCEVEVFNHFFNSETGHLYIDDIYTVCPTLLPIDSIKSIEFSSNVTRIGYGAFKNCSSLTSITLPKSLVEFGREAFYNCSSLTSIIIPDSVEIIGEKAFEGCTNLKTVINFSSLDIVKGSETHGHVAYYAEKVLKPGIELNYSELSMAKGDSFALSATIIPEMPVTWSSSANSIATVDQNGNVTAVGVGTATIKATAGNYSATCKVTVTIPVSGIILSQDTISLMEGQGMTLSATVLPDSATDKTVKWSSSDISVATVNRVGRVIGKGVGTATITATAGDYSATCVVTVTEKIIYVSNIILSQKSASLIKGEGMTLIATILPENAVDNSLTWSSSDESVATVDHDGNVTATGMGTATIKATAGKCSATCNVTVSEVCYMKNVGAGLFLAGGNAWGTQSSFAENGLEVTITKLASGKCIIDTKVDNSGSHYLGTNGYVDATQAEWSIELQSDGTYTITNDSINYIGYDGSTTVLNMQLKNATDANARWQFITRKELLEEISTATEDSPQNATILLGGADFSPNDTRNNLWSDNPALGGYRTEIAANHCGEKWNTATFDVAQTLTNIPNGYYKISVQGFYRMGGDNNNDATIAAKNHAAGTEMLNAVFYANNEEKELMSIISGAQSNTFAHGNAFKTTYGYVPQDMSSAAAAFTDGKYDQSIWVEVTDGTLRLGVKKEYESTNDWTIFDNFRVVYYGVQQPNAIEEIKATINSRTNDVYDLSGRLVRRQGEGLEGLKAGIYIINGKKYIVK